MIKKKPVESDESIRSSGNVVSYIGLNHMFLDYRTGEWKSF